jgi:pyruvate formate lyase activating enzyme
MRCLYCYNNHIVLSSKGKYTINDLLVFLKKRVGRLDAVVLSGGEASIHNLVFICEHIKALGFKIKLDTNGLKTKLIQQLLEKKLIDYCALDFKAPQSKFKHITKTDAYEHFLNTLQLFVEHDFDFEVRTTVHEDLLNEDDVNEMIDVLVTHGYTKEYYLQFFLETPTNIGNIQASLKNFDMNKLDAKHLNIVRRN